MSKYEISRKSPNLTATFGWSQRKEKRSDVHQLISKGCLMRKHRTRVRSHLGVSLTVLRTLYQSIKIRIMRYIHPPGSHKPWQSRSIAFNGYHCQQLVPKQVKQEICNHGDSRRVWINSVKLTPFSKGIPLLFIEVKGGFSLRNSDPVGHLFRKWLDLQITATREGLASAASDGRKCWENDCFSNFAVGGSTNGKSIDSRRSSCFGQRGAMRINSALYKINLFRVCLIRAVGGYA